MAAIGTPATLDAPYPSGMKNNSVVVNTLAGAGVTTTEIVAATSGSQIHIVGGHISASKTCVVNIFTAATPIARVVFVAAGTQPFPACWAEDNENLKIDNGDAATLFIRVETVKVTSGQYNPMAE